MPWYCGRARPSARASPSFVVLPTTIGGRVCGTASAPAPTVTTTSTANVVATVMMHSANVA